MGVQIARIRQVVMPTEPRAFWAEGKGFAILLTIVHKHKRSVMMTSTVLLKDPENPAI
jgi:hypothetical protein